MTQLQDVSAETIHQRLLNHEIVLIDVREPGEHAGEHIEGALLFPLSSFDPAQLPQPEGREIVFHCAGGKRSAMAVMRCLEQGLPHSSHMSGGLHAWKSSGLPTQASRPVA
jgi:rhodanese-related sulfurtransferase